MLVLERESEDVPGVCCLRFLGSRERRLGEEDGGGGHHRTRPFSECVCNQTHPSLLAGGSLKRYY